MILEAKTQKIQKLLKKIEDKQNIKILFAVEGGSRVYGFESLDSDYDIRFIYVRPVVSYLDLEEKRDTLIYTYQDNEDLFDFHGWDIQKALKLLKKGNPTLFEWISSPTVYVITNSLLELQKLSKLYYSPQRSFYHYHSLSKKTFDNELKFPKVKLKDYLYCIRGVMNCHWILKNSTVFPPLDLNTCINNSLTTDKKIIYEINKLLFLKRNKSEKSIYKKIPLINNYLNKQILNLSKQGEKILGVDKDYKDLNNYFIRLLMKVNIDVNKL